MDAVLDWAAVVLPTILALVGVFVSVETPEFQTQRQKLFWRGGLVAFGVFVSVVTAFQQKNARHDSDAVKELLSTIADAVKVDRNLPASTLTNEVLRRLEKLENPPRQNDFLYQDGQPIARVAGINIDQTTATVSFQVVTAERMIDFSKQIELQRLRILCSSPKGPQSVMSFGAAQSFTYADVTCKAVGRRQ
jgi:hypothetical protein